MLTSFVTHVANTQQTCSHSLFHPKYFGRNYFISREGNKRNVSVFYVPPRPPSAPGRELGLIFCWACATGSQCPYPIYIIVYSVVAVSRPCRLLEFYLNRVTARPKGRAIKLTENSSIMFKLFSLHCMQSSWL